MKTVKHEENGAWVISNENGTAKAEFYKDGAGIAIYTRRTYRVDSIWEVDANVTFLDKEEMELLKKYLLTPEEEAAGSVLPSEGAGDA